MIGKKEFEEKGVTASLIVRTMNPLQRTGKVVFTDSGVCVLEGLISMVEKGVFRSDLLRSGNTGLRGCQQRRFFGT